MSGAPSENDTTPAPDPNDVNYEAPTNVRSGAGATDAAADETTEGEETTEAGTEDETDEERAQRASEAGTTLAGRKGSLKADLQKEREKRQAAEERATTVERMLESWRPYLERLNGRPDLQTALVEGRITVQQAEAQKDRDDQAELREIAEDMGYFKAKSDGTPDYDRPDLDRAERYRARHQKWAKATSESVVSSTVAPIAARVSNRDAAGRIDHAVKYCADNQHADPEFVRGELVKWATRNPNALLDDQQANAIYEQVVGRALMHGKVFKGQKREAPAADTGDRTFVHTEAPGGRRNPSAPRLTQAEKALGEQYGLTDKDWQLAEDHSKVRRGYTRLTED